MSTDVLPSTVPQGGSRRDRLLRLALLALWCAVTAYLASRHIFWRDEVRAFSIALQGDTVVDMLRGLHGEGHPAIWYLLLRGAYQLTGLREVLPILGWLIAAASMAVLVFRSPFRLGTVALVMFGFMGLYEYTVTARNYGMSMLIMVVIAATYSRHRDRGIMTGLLLALLCNTNVPANFLAAAMLCFWAVELLCEEGWRWTRKHNVFVVNAVIVLVGVILCFVQVFPTVHDAAVKPHPDGITLVSVFLALVSPVQAFPNLGLAVLGEGPFGMAILTVLLVGALVGLARAPAALLSTAFVFLTIQLFAELVYRSSYRHQALLLVYMLVMYWLVAQGRGGRWPRFASALDRPVQIGRLLFTLLLALQVALSLLWLNWHLTGVPPSRARDLADLLRREGLTQAIVIANPDTMLEPLPYYTPNPLYLLREQRFGQVVRFTRHARLDLDLGDILLDAKTLAATHDRPVVILLRERLEVGAPGRTIPSPYIGTFSVSPDDAARFFAATRRLARFAPALTDESYDVYLLRPPSG